MSIKLCSLSFDHERTFITWITLINFFTDACLIQSQIGQIILCILHKECVETSATITCWNNMHGKLARPFWPHCIVRFTSNPIRFMRYLNNLFWLRVTWFRDLLIINIINFVRAEINRQLLRKKQYVLINRKNISILL